MVKQNVARCREETWTYICHASDIPDHPYNIQTGSFTTFAQISCEKKKNDRVTILFLNLLKHKWYVWQVVDSVYENVLKESERAVTPEGRRPRWALYSHRVLFTCCVCVCTPRLGLGFCLLTACCAPSEEKAFAFQRVDIKLFPKAPKSEFRPSHEAQHILT